jgi:3-methylcrotonyl-CoA carboxylase alpha subunit
MISKLIAYGETREIANERLTQALNHYIINGINTNISFLIAMLQSDAFVQNNISTKFCDENTDMIIKAIDKQKSEIDLNEIICTYLVHHFNKSKNVSESIWSQIGYWRNQQQIEIVYNEESTIVAVETIENDNYVFNIDGKEYSCHLKEYSDDYIRLNINSHCQKMYISEDGENGNIINLNSFSFKLKRSDILYDTDFFQYDDEAGKGNMVKSPMPGKVIKIDIKIGDEVTKGTRLLVVEAMKMENNITAPRDGKIASIGAEEGEMVDGNTPLVIFETEEEE